MKTILAPRCRRLALPGAVAACLALPAAAETFQPQEGCTHVVTIQSEGCYVRHATRCPTLSDGLLVYGTDKAGAVTATVFDADGATTIMGPQAGLMMLKDRTDLFSIAALIAGGTDTYDYTAAAADGAEARFVGTTVLTGETVEIDGRLLRVVTTRQTATPPGGVPIETETTAYLDEGLPLMLTAEVRDVASGQVTVRRAPVDYLFPGEDGALDAEPRIGCEG